MDKVYVAFTENHDNYHNFHGVFSTGKKAKEIFGPRTWERKIDQDGDWYYMSPGEDCDYIVFKTNINQTILAVD